MPQLWLNDTLDLLAAPYTAEVGTEFGDWQAITTAVDSLFLDGSVVSGEATGNRTVRLQVSVAASPRWALVEACEALFVEANKAASTLRFVPDEGDAEVYDLFRAQPERTDDQSEAWLRRSYVFSFPALPFVRSGVRQTPMATAPSIILADFEDQTLDGIVLGSYCYNGQAPPSEIDYAVPTTEVQPPFDFLDAADLEADTNCTIRKYQGQAKSIDGGYHAEDFWGLTATTAGDVVARTIQTWPVTGDVATVGAVFTSDDPAAAIGIEWLDGAGATLGVTWGVASTCPPPGDALATYTAWAVDVAPVGAASYRMKVKVLGVAAGVEVDVDTRGMVGSQASIGDADRRGFVDGYQGSYGMRPNATWPGRPWSSTPTQFAAFHYQRIAAPVDVSAMARLDFHFRMTAATAYPTVLGANGCYVSLRLFDSTGRWSRWNCAYPDGALPLNQWVALSTPLVRAPDDIAAGGAADLADVAAYSIDQGQVIGAVDLVSAAPPLPDTISTTRGTVYDLDIVGAARSPVRVDLTGPVPMTDWLVAAADMAVPPMLAVASNVATAAAPAPYDGVYRVIGALAPASAETNPTCTVAQLIDGVQVASQVLDGTLQDGNHYVDFGVCPLPMVGVPADNSGVSYTFTLSPADTDWAEVLVLDMARPVAWLPNIATPMAYGWIDEPEPTAQMGRVWVGSNADRSDARSPADPPDLSLPFSVRTPGVQLLVYSTSGAPDVSLSYDPRRLS